MSKTVGKITLEICDEGGSLVIGAVEGNIREVDLTGGAVSLVVVTPDASLCAVSGTLTPAQLIALNQGTAVAQGQVIQIAFSALFGALASTLEDDASGD